MSGSLPRVSVSKWRSQKLNPGSLAAKLIDAFGLYDTLSRGKLREKRLEKGLVSFLRKRYPEQGKVQWHDEMNDRTRRELPLRAKEARNCEELVGR